MLEKITQEQMEQHGVVSAPDELKGRPEDAKAVFDRLIREVVSKVVNGIIDAHNGLDEDVNERIDGVIEELKKISEINAENLGSSNIQLDKKGEDTLAKAYGLTSVVPTVYEALAAALGKFVNKSGDTMTGNLTIERPLFPHVMLRSLTQNRDAYYEISSDGTAVIGLRPINDKTNARELLLNKETSSLENALLLADTQNSIRSEYNILHTGNMEAMGVGQVVIGSYVGTGLYGAENANSLTFIAPPKFLMVQQSGNGGLTSNTAGMAVMRGQISYNTTDNANHRANVDIAWNENIVSWYADSGSTNSSASENQLNLRGDTYLYIAIL